MKSIVLILILLAALFIPAQQCAADPEPGQTLPEYCFPAPENQSDREYLKLGDASEFTFSDLPTPYLLVEIIGVYCPQCRSQLPGFNKLFKRLQRTDLSERIKMLSIAAGATPAEAAYLRKKDYPFPVVRDEDYGFHKQIEEPLTPFTMVVTREGEVLYAHLGMINDIDGFLQDIQRLTK